MTEGSSLSVDVDVRDVRWANFLDDPTALCRDVLAHAWGRLDTIVQEAEVSVVLHDDQAQQRLNAGFRDIDASTNVLSFPSDLDQKLLPPGEPYPLGDITLALEKVTSEADLAGIKFVDHLSHLLIHGMLHLNGYDHETECEAEMMEGLEVQILAGLGIADPYASIEK